MAKIKNNGHCKNAIETCNKSGKDGTIEHDNKINNSEKALAITSADKNHVTVTVPMPGTRLKRREREFSTSP